MYAGEIHDHETEQWTEQIDRGGLTYVRDDVFQLFVAFEKEIRKHLHSNCATEKKGVRDVAVAAIIDDDDVQMHWTEISSNWVENQDCLLKMLITHWVTIRGFSYASSFMETYKQEQRRTLQKSKGLRKTLNCTTVADDTCT